MMLLYIIKRSQVDTCKLIFLVPTEAGSIWGGPWSPHPPGALAIKCNKTSFSITHVSPFAPLLIHEPRERLMHTVHHKYSSTFHNFLTLCIHVNNSGSQLLLVQNVYIQYNIVEMCIDGHP